MRRRRPLAQLLFAFYFLPLCAWLLFGQPGEAMAPQLAALGCFAALALVLFLVLKKWEGESATPSQNNTSFAASQLAANESHHDLASLQSVNDLLQAQLEQKERDILQCEQAALHRVRELEDGMRRAENTMTNDLEKKMQALSERVHNAEREAHRFRDEAEIRRQHVVEKEERIQELMGELHNLRYEMHALLKSERRTILAPTQSRSWEAGAAQAISAALSAPQTSFGDVQAPDARLRQWLKRLGELADGSQLVGRGHLWQGLSMEAMPLEMRRICDALKAEVDWPLCIISRSDSRVIFATPLVRQLFGWSSERFAKEFPHLTVRGISEISVTLDALRPGAVKRVPLTLQTLSGALVECRLFLGCIESEAFSDCALGLIWPSAEGMA